jgi:hypothetical protein
MPIFKLPKGVKKHGWAGLATVDFVADIAQILMDIYRGKPVDDGKAEFFKIHIYKNYF